MAQDLRTFLAVLERENQVIKLSKEVDPKSEMNALAWQVLPEKVMFLENLKGFPRWRACAGVIETRERIGRVLGVSEDQLLSKFSKITEQRPIKCEMTSDGPVKEFIRTGNKVDLDALPVGVMCERDGGPYLTFSEVITKDPETDVYNAAIVRIQTKSLNKAGIYLIRGRHTWENYLKYEKRNEPMPVAIVIGHHPALHLMGIWSGAYDTDELDLAGTIMGEPLRVVKCETIDLKAPADAEVIIEGEIPPGIREMEGPFAEFTGYYPAPHEEPIVNIKAITRRNDPIYEFTWTGRWKEYTSLGIEQYLFKRLREVEGHIDLRDVHIFSQVDAFLVVIQLVPAYEGQAKNVLLAALSGTTLHPKIAVAVDEDVNIHDPADVLWAIANRTNPEADVFIIGGTRNHPFDIKIPQEPTGTALQRTGAKMGIDATKPPVTKPQARRGFERARPVGWGKVNLQDFLK